MAEPLEHIRHVQPLQSDLDSVEKCVICGKTLDKSLNQCYNSSITNENNQ